MRINNNPTNNIKPNNVVSRNPEEKSTTLPKRIIKVETNASQKLSIDLLSLKRNNSAIAVKKSIVPSQLSVGLDPEKTRSCVTSVASCVQDEIPFSLVTLSTKQKVDTKSTEQALKELSSGSSIEKWLSARNQANLTRKFVVVENPTKVQERQETRADTIGLAEDFISTTQLRRYEDRLLIGDAHAWKRANMYLKMCTFIQQNAPDLKQYDFPHCEKNQFAACVNIVPENYVSNKAKNVKLYTNTNQAHIALLNKIVVKPENEVVSRESRRFYLKGKIEHDQKEVGLEDFFNLCDIVPITVNEIDGIMEDNLRAKATSNLNLVKTSKMSPEKAADELASLYIKELTKLQSDLFEGTKHFQGTKLELIRKDKIYALNYIIGMKNAMTDFAYLMGNKEFQTSISAKITDRDVFGSVQNTA